jgi:hypothetical protein
MTLRVGISTKLTEASPEFRMIANLGSTGATGAGVWANATEINKRHESPDKARVLNLLMLVNVYITIL